MLSLFEIVLTDKDEVKTEGSLEMSSNTSNQSISNNTFNPICKLCINLFLNQN